MTNTKLKIARVKKGLTQAELSQASGVSRTIISELEQGKRDGSSRTLAALADALGTSVTALFYRQSVYSAKQK